MCALAACSASPMRSKPASVSSNALVRQQAGLGPSPAGLETTRLAPRRMHSRLRASRCERPRQRLQLHRRPSREVGDGAQVQRGAHRERATACRIRRAHACEFRRGRGEPIVAEERGCRRVVAMRRASREPLRLPRRALDRRNGVGVQRIAGDSQHRLRHHADAFELGARRCRRRAPHRPSSTNSVLSIKFRASVVCARTASSAVAASSGRCSRPSIALHADAGVGLFNSSSRDRASAAHGECCRASGIPSTTLAPRRSATTRSPRARG